MRILGVDPGLLHTGWGVVDGAYCVGFGVLDIPCSIPISSRLAMLYEELTGVLDEYKPDEVAIESVFVNSNGHSTMKLCMARGVVMLVPGIRALRVAEYSATQIKKTLTGQGHASKSQVRMMVNATLSWRSAAATQSCDRMDAADALAVAICHERYSHIKTFNLAAS